VPWPPILFLATCVLALLTARIYALPWPGIDDTPARIIGYGFGLAGLALIAWALTTLRRAGTTYRPDQGADRLVTDGPFRYRRNPIYMGDAMLLLGFAQLTSNIWFAILMPAFLVAVYFLAVLPEERHLEERFGQAYLDYKESTRRWF
jgi:protein-S-isoprenylcysteine O-methyltransferase Ste14